MNIIDFEKKKIESNMLLSIVYHNLYDVIKEVTNEKKKYQG